MPCLYQGRRGGCKQKNGQKKASLSAERLFQNADEIVHPSGAAGSFGTTASAAGTEVDPAVQFEAVHVKIHLDGLGFFEKVLVDDEFVTIDLECFIRLDRLVQSHGQAGAASPAFVQEYPDRLNVFTFEILGDLVDRRLCDFQHVALLRELSARKVRDATKPIGFQAKNLTMSI
jgi:hypothetical protein